MDKYTIDRINQLEQRIRELEIKQITDLDDVNKRMRAIDRKLRRRIQVLERQVDSILTHHKERLLDELVHKGFEPVKPLEDITDNERFDKLKNAYDTIFQANKEKYLSGKPKRVLSEEEREFWDKGFSKPNVIAEFNYNTGEIKSKLAPRIAIRVENEEEFNELMDIMESKGWKWVLGERQIYPSRDEELGRVCVYFENNCTWGFEHEEWSCEIIPFQTLKAIL